MPLHRHSLATCRTVYRHICENLDSDLDSPACRDVKKHLDACTDCRAYLESLKQTVDLYRRYPVPRAPKAVRDALLAAIATKGRPRVRKR